MPPKGSSKRAKREPVEAVDDEEAEAALYVEFPVHEIDGYEVPLVCRDASEYYSVMGVLFWSHYNSLEAGIMRFFDTKEACVLRLVHSEFRDAVSATPWHDLRTVIKGSVASWRECFGLRAQAASVFDRKDLVDADFVHFRGLAALNMGCSSGFSDAAYANLRGIGFLRMGCCAVEVGAISHLKGVQEIGMWGCDFAVTASAFEILQGACSTVLNPQQNPMSIAMQAGDLPEIRRLLATRSVGSASWLYAGVSFYDIPAPATSNDVIAAACVELLQVGIEVESAGMTWEASNAIMNFTRNENGRTAALVSIGVAVALVTALKQSVCWTNVAVCANLCASLSHLACIEDGRVACLSSNAILVIVPLLKYHCDDAAAVDNMCATLSNLSVSPAGVTACISSGGVYQMVAALKRHAKHTGVCVRASRALRNISGFADGVAACLSADAIPYLLAAYESQPSARERAKAALENLGVDI